MVKLHLLTRPICHSILCFYWLKTFIVEQSSLFHFTKGKVIYCTNMEIMSRKYIISTSNIRKANKRTDVLVLQNAVTLSTVSMCTYPAEWIYLHSDRAESGFLPSYINNWIDQSNSLSLLQFVCPYIVKIMLDKKINLALFESVSVDEYMTFSLSRNWGRLN